MVGRRGAGNQLLLATSDVEAREVDVRLAQQVAHQLAGVSHAQERALRQLALHRQVVIVDHRHLQVRVDGVDAAQHALRGSGAAARDCPDCRFHRRPNPRRAECAVCEKIRLPCTRSYSVREAAAHRRLAVAERAPGEAEARHEEVVRIVEAARRDRGNRGQQRGVGDRARGPTWSTGMSPARTRPSYGLPELGTIKPGRRHASPPAPDCSAEGSKLAMLLAEV